MYTLLIADETSDLRKFYMAENEIGNENEYDNGDEFDKVNNTTTFTTGSGLFELSRYSQEQSRLVSGVESCR